MLETILTVVVGAIVPALAIYLVTQALKLNATIDGLPTLAKRVLTVVEAFALAQFGSFVGLDLGMDLGSLDATTVQTALSTLFAWLIHKLFPTKPA